MRKQLDAEQLDAEQLDAEQLDQGERAEDIHARALQLALAGRRLTAAMAFELQKIKDGRHYAALGFASISAYAWAIAEISSSKLSDLLRVTSREAELPKLMKVFRSGELSYLAATEVARVATPETEELWLQLAFTVGISELRRRAQGKDLEVFRGFRFQGGKHVHVDDAIDRARKEPNCEHFSAADALAEICRRFSEGEVGGGTKSFRILITECPTCERATRASRDGPVEVPPRELARIRCDCELHDLSQTPSRVTKTIPPSTRNRVLDRDERSCQVPGCGRKGRVDLHHVFGRGKGHHPDHLYVSCDSHHRQVHADQLIVRGHGPRYHFFLADGTYLGESGDLERADLKPERKRGDSSREESGPEATKAEATKAEATKAEATKAEATSQRSSNSSREESPRALAKRVLRKLEMGARQAESALRQVAGSPNWSAEEWVEAALQTVS